MIVREAHLNCQFQGALVKISIVECDSLLRCLDALQRMLSRWQMAGFPFDSRIMRRDSPLPSAGLQDSHLHISRRMVLLVLLLVLLLPVLVAAVGVAAAGVAAVGVAAAVAGSTSISYLI